MSDWKEQLLKNAMKVMQSSSAQKVMSNEKFQDAIGKAFEKGFAIKSEIDEQKIHLAKRLNLATNDDLRTMKRELDRLQRQVGKLKKENKALKKDE